MLYQPRRRYFNVALFTTLILISGSILAGGAKVPLPPLPKIVLPAPPAMIWLPGLQVYVAHDSPYPIFHRDGRYYLNHGRAWYIGPGYNGPWAAANARQIPPGLRNYRRERWDDYQREAARRFREDRDHDHTPFYGHRHERARWKEDDHGPGQRGDADNHEERGQGRDRGHDE